MGGAVSALPVTLSKPEAQQLLGPRFDEERWHAVAGDAQVLSRDEFLSAVHEFHVNVGKSVFAAALADADCPQRCQASLGIAAEPTHPVRAKTLTAKAARRRAERDARQGRRQRKARGHRVVAVDLRVAKSGYNLLTRVIESLNWTEVMLPSQRVDLLWGSGSRGDEGRHLAALERGAKINRIPEMVTVANKAVMTLHLERQRRLFPDE